MLPTNFGYVSRLSTDNPNARDERKWQQQFLRILLAPTT